jgi:hypothetical protein
VDVNDLFKDFHRAIESFRRAVSKTIPMATRIAWAEKKNQIQRSQPGITRRKFIYIMSRSRYEQNWGKQYDRPTVGDQILSLLLKVLPPIGPIRAVKLKMPTPAVEKLFMNSFDRSAHQLSRAIDHAMDQSLQLDSKNYDVGVVTPAGVYRLDDDVQAYWLDLLARKHFTTVTPAIRTELLAYYSNLDAPVATKRDSKKWQQLLSELQLLKASAPAVQTAAAGAP